MGKNSDIKKLRGQMRQIIQEMLPEIFTKELVAELQKNLAGQLREGLSKIDERQKELQSYMVRNYNVPVINKKE